MRFVVPYPLKGDEFGGQLRSKDNAEANAGYTGATSGEYELSMSFPTMKSTSRATMMTPNPLTSTSFPLFTSP